MQKLSAAAILLLFSHPVLAFDSSGISLSDGQPIKKQNKQISSWDLGLRHDFWQLGDEFARMGMSARVGQLSLDDESALRAGVGTFIAKDIGLVTLSVPIGVLWLEQSEFGKNQIRTKNYGGNVQFTYGAEAAFNLVHQFQVFYRFEHMSNAYMYDHNPAFDSHNIGFRFKF